MKSNQSSSTISTIVFTNVNLNCFKDIQFTFESLFSFQYLQDYYSQCQYFVQAAL